jgi:hypothetical protein
MDEVFDVVCCFCGEGLSLVEATVLIARPNFNSDEQQQLFCHKKHFTDSINKEIPLHPDFFE